MKHQAWRHDPACYGPPQPVLARFADVDTRRHVNNIAVYGLHHEARQRWLMASAGAALWPEGRLRIKPQHSRTEFWLECHYPAPVQAGVRLLAAAPAGLTLAGGLFQQGRCVGVQQASLAAWDHDLATPRPLPPVWADALAAQVQPPETAAEATTAGPADAGTAAPLPRGAGQRCQYAIEATYAARYGDHDADGCSSEAAVLRGLEQARAALLQAMADCVMVYTDPAGPAGPLPLPARLLQALQALAWRHDRPFGGQR